MNDSVCVEGANSHPPPSLAAVGTRTDNRNNLSLIYFNARTLVPKFDELCLIVSAHNPDIIAIVESWLCPDISDHEICIPGYHLFRQDRNRHGGGVLLYVRDHLTAVVLPSHYTNNLEFLPAVIHHLGLKFCFVYQSFIVLPIPLLLFLILFIVL